MEPRVAAPPARSQSVPAVKFCGLTRSEDAAAATALGARFLGVIFAGGPRLLTPSSARAVYEGAGGTFARVGVFGRASATDIARVAAEVSLDVVQLHGDPAVTDVEEVRRLFGGRVWAVARVAGDQLPPNTKALFAAADGVVLDAKVPGLLGGSGVQLGWNALASQVDRARGQGRLVLAGGLTPDNVAEAVRALAPDVVDVSSGVERAPGVKDHARMAAFFAAARGSSPAPAS